MHTYGVVADDAPILQASGRGDIFEMQQMFEAGAASPFDRDANGWGLWEVSRLGGFLVEQFLTNPSMASCILTLTSCASS